MPNTTIASAEDRFARSRCAAAAAASSARSAGECRTSARPQTASPAAPPGPAPLRRAGTAPTGTCPGWRTPGPPAGHAERLDHVIVEKELPAGRRLPGISEPGQPAQRGGVAPPRPAACASPRPPYLPREGRPCLKYSDLKQASGGCRGAADKESCHHGRPGPPPPADPGRARPHRHHPARLAHQPHHPLPAGHCRCHATPPILHGPYPTWTRKAGARSITRTLTPQEAERLRPYFAAHRRPPPAHHRTRSHLHRTRRTARTTTGPATHPTGR